MTDSQFINPNEDTRITFGSLVKLHFEVSLENGTVIDSTFSRDAPVTLTIGDESLLPGFEQVLMNLRAGDTRSAHLDRSSKNVVLLHAYYIYYYLVVIY